MEQLNDVIMTCPIGHATNYNVSVAVQKMLLFHLGGLGVVIL